MNSNQITDSDFYHNFIDLVNLKIANIADAEIFNSRSRLETLSRIFRATFGLDMAQGNLERAKELFPVPINKIERASLMYKSGVDRQLQLELAASAMFGLLIDYNRVLHTAFPQSEEETAVPYEDKQKTYPADTQVEMDINSLTALGIQRIGLNNFSREQLADFQFFRFKPLTLSRLFKQMKPEQWPYLKPAYVGKYIMHILPKFRFMLSDEQVRCIDYKDIIETKRHGFYHAQLRVMINFGIDHQEYASDTDPSQGKRTFYSAFPGEAPFTASKRSQTSGFAEPGISQPGGFAQGGPGQGTYQYQDYSYAGVPPEGYQPWGFAGGPGQGTYQYQDYSYAGVPPEGYHSGAPPSATPQVSAFDPIKLQTYYSAIDEAINIIGVNTAGEKGKDSTYELVKNRLMKAGIKWNPDLLFNDEGVSLSLEERAAAHRNLRNAVHPDKNLDCAKEATALFKAVQCAYDLFR